METKLIALLLIALLLVSMTSMFRTRTDEEESLYNNRYDDDAREYSEVTHWRPHRTHGPPQGPAFLRAIAFVVFAGTLLILVMKLLVVSV